MQYLIDTDWVIDHLSDVEAAIQLLEKLSEDGIAISIITYMEVYQGLDRSPNREDALAKLHIFLEGVPVVPFSLAVARRCARLREQLKQQGKRVNSRAFDLIIAATALEHNLTLVTRNLDDYHDIPDLTLYQSS
jgi:predicted nucleic acid-binding protein